MNDLDLVEKKSLKYNIYPNLTVFDRFVNDVFIGWRVIPKNGYVISDKNSDKTYFNDLHLPKNFNWSLFSYVSLPRNSVDEKYIF